MVSYYRKKSFDTQYHILHDDKINILEKLDSINDLGVTFDKNLSFKDHISQKINKAYSILGIIKRNFIYMIQLLYLACMLRRYTTVWVVNLVSLNETLYIWILGCIKKIKVVRLSCLGCQFVSLVDTLLL